MPAPSSHSPLRFASILFAALAANRAEPMIAVAQPRSTSMATRPCQFDNASTPCDFGCCAADAVAVALFANAFNDRRTTLVSSTEATAIIQPQRGEVA